MEQPAILQANAIAPRTGHLPDLPQAPAWSIGVLGPLDVRHAGNAITLPPRRRGLLALLALRAGTLVTPEQLVDGLWGDDAPPTAIRTLHAHLAKIGAAMSEFAPGRPIRRRDPGYVLDAQAVQVDRDRFEELTATGLRRFAEARYGEAARHLGAGLELWRGAALSGCPVHGWAAAEANYLEELRLQAYEGLFAARLASGSRTEAGEIGRLVAEHPLRERLWELLIVALQVSGRAGEALAAYQRARRTLVDELGIEPGEGLRHAEAAVLRGIRQPLRLLRLAASAAPAARPAPGTLAAPAATAGPAARGPVPLPQDLSTLIGRDAEIAGTTALLRTARLVTLTGFGGCGKTRLAAAVARAAAGDFADVAFADLAAVRDKDGVVNAVAAALVVQVRPGAPVLDALAHRVRGDRALIVMDNCEHVIDACAEVARHLLTRCPNLTILATSQEPLGLPGEATRVVPALSTPHPAVVRGPADLDGYDAVALFLDRAQIGSARELSPPDARAVAAICARCEGLPLAIELAAARARLLSLPEIARQLDDPYQVLTDGPSGSRPQHRALRATVEWSLHLLTGADRDALRRLSVLGGAFTLETAAAVHPDAPILRTLGRLVDRSLLKALRTPAGMRYQLPETIRGHVLAELTARPDEYARARRGHAAHCLRRAEEAERRLQGPDLGTLTAEIAEQHEEMRVAMQWLTRDDPAAALRLAAALWRYHYLRGRYGEGRDWLRRALAAATGDVPGTVLAKARWAAARLAALECDYPEADALARSAMELYSGAGDDDGVARCQVLLCAILRELGDYDQAIAFGRLALDAAERRGDAWATGNALQMLAFASWLSGDVAAAVRLSTRAIRVLTPLGDRERLAWCRLDLGAAALYGGKTETASRHLAQALLVFLQVRFKEGIAWAENLLALVDLRRGLTESALRRLVTGLRLHHELGDRWRQASVLDALAETAARLGDTVFAAELLGAAAHIRAEIGAPVPACELPAHARATALVRDTPGAAGVAEAYERGACLGVEDVHHQVTRLLARRARRAAPA